MGRPLNKKFFGDTAGAGNQIQVEAFIPGGSGAVTAFIVKQNSNTTYTVSDGSDTGRCKLQSTAITAAGQMRISVVPFDGVPNVTATATVPALAGAAITTGDVTITNGGTGYSVAPTVTINGDGTVDPTATATIVGGIVTAVTVTGGSADHNIVTVAFSSPAVGGVTEFASILNAHVVKTFSGNVYKWSELAAAATGESDLDLV